MSGIPSLIEQDRAVANRCFFHGTTTLGGTDACRPELQIDGTIILRSLNLSHVAYKVTEEEYLELRKYPKRKIGIWEFVSEDDEDADRIASATRYPESAGRRIGALERDLEAHKALIAAKDAELASATTELDRLRRECSDGLDALSDIDDFWEACPYPDNRKHLSVAEQVSSLDSELNAAHDQIAAKDAEISRLRKSLSDISGYDRNFYDNGRPGYEKIARDALHASEREG